MKFIWATRGKTWGFRFLRTAGLPNPLLEYEEAFAGTEGASDAFQRRAGKLAVRFPDPEHRRDRAGRIIPHEFVLIAPDNVRFSDDKDARAALWHEVEDEYASIWNLPAGPSQH